MEANNDGGGLHRGAAGQAAQHRLNGETFGFLTVDDRPLLQLNGFEGDAALWGWKEIAFEFLCMFSRSDRSSHRWCSCSSQPAGSRNEQR